MEATVSYLLMLQKNINPKQKTKIVYYKCCILIELTFRKDLMLTKQVQ